jgi:hypothetical protein
MFEDLGSQHTVLLLHTEVGGYREEKCLLDYLNCVESSAYFLDHIFHLSERLTKISWLLRVVYLADIFTKLN